MGLTVVKRSSGTNLDLSEQDLYIHVVERAVHAPVWPIRADPPRAPGVYALMYRGALTQYAELARRRVASSSSIASTGGYPIYVGSAAHLSQRLSSHRRKLTDVSNLKLDDFELIWLETERLPIALLGEAILIETLRPVWNMTPLAGFGSKAQGHVRTRGQRTAPWRVLHPPKASGTAAENADQLWAITARHIEATVPPWW